MNEILVILFVALLVYGGKLPEVARSLGKTIGSLRRTLLESAAEVKGGAGDLRNLASMDITDGSDEEEERPRTVRRIAPRELATEDVSGEPAPPAGSPETSAAQPAPAREEPPQAS